MLSPRPAGPRAGVGFLGRGQPASAPPRLSGGALQAPQAGSGVQPVAAKLLSHV